MLTNVISFMEKIWKLKEEADKKQVADLSTALNVSPSIAHLLVQRGITDFEAARSFFRPAFTGLHDPFLMKDMKKAVKRIDAALQNKENILIYGDYDVDGTTAVALVYSFFRSLMSYKNVYPDNGPQPKLDYYIPDRYKEGYGISYRGIDHAKEKGFSLMIALDCGIKANEKILYAKEKGLDVIICDHHTPGKSIPEAVAVLDPKQTDCMYPYKELSGCGVGYKLLQAFCIENHIPQADAEKYIDLVAVSIASDIVPITGENRILAYYGIEKLNENPLTGLKTIIKLSGIEKKRITISDIVFKIGPRINAAGRIDAGKQAVELLISDDAEEALKTGKIINVHNTTRKDIDQQITKEALALIEAKEALQTNRTTVLFNPEWHKGVVGIVASRLIESYYRPTVILTKSNGMATGSARSVAGYNLYNAIDACADLLENYGGHMYAAGLTLKVENLAAFQQRFEEVVLASITDDLLIPRIDVDMEIMLHDINSKFFRIIAQFGPFGPGNMTPVFVSRNVCMMNEARVVGETGEHLKLNVIQDTDNPQVFPAIAFGQAHHLPELQKGTPFDICYTVEENTFRGNTSLQLRIKDIK